MLIVDKRTRASHNIGERIQNRRIERGGHTNPNRHSFWLSCLVRGAARDSCSGELESLLESRLNFAESLLQSALLFLVLVADLLVTLLLLLSLISPVVIWKFLLIENRKTEDEMLFANRNTVIWPSAS